MSSIYGRQLKGSPSPRICLPLLEGNHFLLLKITRIGKKLCTRSLVTLGHRVPQMEKDWYRVAEELLGLQLLSD